MCLASTGLRRIWMARMNDWLDRPGYGRMAWCDDDGGAGATCTGDYHYLSASTRFIHPPPTYPSSHSHIHPYIHPSNHQPYRSALPQNRGVQRSLCMIVVVVVVVVISHGGNPGLIGSDRVVCPSLMLYRIGG